MVRLAWFAGQSDLREGKDPAAAGPPPAGCFRPWYAGRFAGIGEVTAYWREHYDELRRKTRRFSDCFYDSTLPPEVLEAVGANFSILKSPTVLRQTDGKLWGWEGCGDGGGCCSGSCTHVWNYAQAMAHLFPGLERTLRETEFGPSQNEAGHQTFRSALPIRPVEHGFYAAADGQLGGMMKVFRDWRVSGDTAWLRSLWPKVKRSLDYCIETWDPRHEGMVEEPHHNTYDIEFWGPDGMCTSFYLGALQAAVTMGKALGDDIPLYSELYGPARGTRNRNYSMGNILCSASSGKACAPKTQRGSQALAAAIRRKRSPFLRKKGRSINTAPAVFPMACLVRGWLWSAASARCWMRRW